MGRLIGPLKEAENQGIVETRPRSGTIRVKSKSCTRAL